MRAIATIGNIVPAAALIAEPVLGAGFRASRQRCDIRRGEMIKPAPNQDRDSIECPQTVYFCPQILEILSDKVYFAHPQYAKGQNRASLKGDNMDGKLGIPFSFVAVVAIQAQGATPVGTSTPITLDAFSVDTPYRTSSIVDAGSGVTFSNPNTPAGHLFIIDYYNASTRLPTLTPGRVLSSNGYVGNGGISMPYDFGFTMTLPRPTAEVDLTLGYILNATDAALAVSGYTPSGDLLGTLSYRLSPATGELPLSFATPGNSIGELVIVPTDVFDVFGQMSYATVPEPAVSVANTALGVSLLVRRRRARTL